MNIQKAITKPKFTNPMHGLPLLDLREKYTEAQIGRTMAEQADFERQPSGGFRNYSMSGGTTPIPESVLNIVGSCPFVFDKDASEKLGISADDIRTNSALASKRGLIKRLNGRKIPPIYAATVKGEKALKEMEAEPGQSGPDITAKGQAALNKAEK